ncbi:GNAT family N-acetyltransferase [Hymenobacter elongatus]|nr:GNAT family N-acetyltransferase [Hymenobacter elongatus]
MAKLLTFTRFQDFLEHNRAHIEAHFYVYFHVFKLLPRLRSKQAGVFNAYNIVDEEGRQIIALHVTGSYYLFSFGWTAPMLDLLAAQVEVGKCKQDFQFLGQRDLILELLQKQECQWWVLKERLIYQCDEVLGQSHVPNARVENGGLEDVHALTEMTLAFDIDEYPNKPYRDEDKAFGQVLHGIENNGLFVVKSQGEVCSMVQVIETDGYTKPLLGSLYTLPEHRNKGYASLLLRTVTQGLLQHRGEACGLLSDITNPASNKAFVNVGYRPIYHWINIIMGQATPAEAASQ